MVVLAVSVAAYETDPPRFINVELTWKDAKTGQERTEPGQLWFRDLPVRHETGKVVGFGRPGHYDGIKWFVPKNPGEIWIARSGSVSAPGKFLLRDYCGEREIELAFDEIAVAKTGEAQLTKLMDESVGQLAGGTKAADSKFRELDELDELDPQAPMMSAPVPSTITRGDPVPEKAAVIPVHFALKADLGEKTIPVANLVKIVFQDASDGYRREVYGGRFLQYASRASGDSGRVQVAAATFFGGVDGSERFFSGGFLPDDSILMAGNFLDLSFVDPALVKVLGTDPSADAYPPIERVDAKKNRRTTEYPRRTPTLVRYSADLRKLTGLVRLPWGTGPAYTCLTSADGSLYLAGMAGPHFESLEREIKSVAVIENPDAGKDGKGRVREPGPDGFILKIAADHRSILWAVRVKDSGANIFEMPDGKLLARRGDGLFFISREGSVTEGPKLEITGSNMAVNPKTGEMYFGGSYRSATGLEPYVNPYLYKVDASGKIVWTAYGWTGPIVGVDQLRLVSDSSVTSIRIGEDGNLTLTAWSDGGNTVLGQQPYDLRKAAKCGGFCSSTWGATGGLTVRIGHIISMNAADMEVPSFTRYVGYLPTSDIPTLINIYDIHRLPNGEVAVTGGGWTGFVESHDAWVKPWYIESRTDEHALAKGGPFFTVFTPDFDKVRMATITPGASGLKLAGKGKWVLLYGGATDRRPDEVDQKWDRKLRTITRHAVQPQNGGGLDAYVMLVDTQGEPNPPVIPEKTWGPPPKKK
jgi:hypothetical protein